MKIYKDALIDSLLAIGYITLIATLLTYVGRFIGEKNGVLGGVAFLLTFVISAAIMGAIVLGRPILWYLDGSKKEAVKLFFFTLGFLAIELVIVFSYLLTI